MGLQLMCNSEKYIWLFGENNGRTANNNSFWMWKFIVDSHNDLNAFFVAEKTAKTKAVYSRLTQKEKRLWVWRNSLQHARLYDMADISARRALQIISPWNFKDMISVSISLVTSPSAWRRLKAF